MSENLVLSTTDQVGNKPARSKNSGDFPHEEFVWDPQLRIMFRSVLWFKREITSNVYFPRQAWAISFKLVRSQKGHCEFTSSDKGSG